MTKLTLAAPLCAALMAPLSLACEPVHTAQASPPRAEAGAPAGHYCNMGVFTPAERARLEALVPPLVAATTERRELENGFVFTFSGQFKEAGEWLDSVRRCCPTLDYQLEFERQGGPARLRITGTPGAKEFAREEFRPLLDKTR